MSTSTRSRRGGPKTRSQTLREQEGAGPQRKRGAKGGRGKGGGKKQKEKQEREETESGPAMSYDEAYDSMTSELEQMRIQEVEAVEGEELAGPSEVPSLEERMALPDFEHVYYGEPIRAPVPAMAGPRPARPYFYQRQPDTVDGARYEMLMTERWRRERELDSERVKNQVMMDMGQGLPYGGANIDPEQHYKEALEIRKGYQTRIQDSLDVAQLNMISYGVAMASEINKYNRVQNSLTHVPSRV